MANIADGGEHDSPLAGFYRTVAVLAPQVRRIAIGLFLILAFAATGAVLLFVLTAEQLQNSMAAPDLSATKSTIGAIRQDVATLEWYYGQLDSIAKKQNEADNALAAADVDSRGALARMTSAADDLTGFINENDTAYILPPLKLKPFERNGNAGPATASPPLASGPAPADTPTTTNAALQQDPILNFGSEVTGYYADYYAQLDGIADPAQRDAARKALNDFRNQANKTLAIYLKAHSQFDADTARLASLHAVIGALETQNKGLEDQAAPKDSALHNPAYWNLCEDFLSFKTLVGENAYSIVLLPKMMLVLTLSIFMGILGSLIYISQDFLRDPDGRGFWDILFRIGLGAGVAFALFFFAAAGMLAMTQSASGTSQQNMSPYLISFLGITGGYLSDRVTQWMREVGENTFKVNPGGPPPRWAPGLEGALKAAGQSDAALAIAVGEEPSDVDCWIKLAKPVPGDKQALVAAFLRIHPSKLFTDIPPAKA